MNKQDPNTIIDLIGGTAKVSEICGVTRSAVSQWRSNGIPRAHMRFLEVKFPILRKEDND